LLGLLLRMKAALNDAGGSANLKVSLAFKGVCPCRAEHCGQRSACLRSA
jgi:hypothetical protein